MDERDRRSLLVAWATFFIGFNRKERKAREDIPTFHPSALPPKTRMICPRMVRPLRKIVQFRVK